MGLIRFYLAISVIFSHNGIRIPGIEGHLAVQAFFVISGFYMALVLNEKYVGNILGFYAARYLRLWPSYIVVFLIVLAFIAPVGTQAYTSLTTALYSWGVAITMLFYETLWWFGVDPATKTLIFWSPQARADGISPLIGATHMAHMWSIGVELSFYIVAPLVARKPRMLIAVFIAAFGLHLVVRAYLDPQNILHVRGGFNMFWLFAMGMLAYWIWKYYRNKLDVIRMNPTLVSISGLAVTVMCIAGIKQFGGIYATGGFYLLFAAALVLVFHATRKVNWDRSIGELSYPIYLAHWPIISILITGHRGDWAWTFLIVGITLICSLILYFCVDQQVDRIRKRFAVAPSQSSKKRLPTTTANP